MAKVYNWQLGRTMEYPIEWLGVPERQIAWVFDTNKCIACQTCTIACKNAWTSGKGQEYMFWNNVESKPWGFYPLGWDVRLLEMLGTQTWKDGIYYGKTIFEAAPPGDVALGFIPEREDWSYPNIGEDETSAPVERGAYIKVPHNPWVFYLARICNHCTYPACLAACPRKAIYKRPEDGIVLVDQERCRGYQECIKACPYKKPMFRDNTGKAEKCIACFPRIEGNHQPECVVNCIGKIRIVGFINPPEHAREDNPIDFLVHVRKVALPLYPQFGTQPNVYYIPPIHVPTSFTQQLFGSGVKHAIDTYRTARDDKKLAGLLVLFGCTPHIIHSFDVKNGYAYAYNERGEEIVRVPIKEPIYIRAFYDKRWDVHRFDVT